MAKLIKKARADFFKDCQLVARAPGSYFWAGEHAVMYGQLAIVHPIELYAYVGIDEVGIEGKNYDDFEFEIKGIKQKTDIKTEQITSGHMKTITHQWLERPRIKKFLEFWRTKNQNRQNYFKTKIWFEVPPKCGLNSSGAIAAALASLLQILETKQSDRESLIKQINGWHNKPIEELKEDPVFDAVFRKAWILDDCSHNYSSSGVGPLSSLVGTTMNNLLLYFAQNKGFNSTQPLKRLSKDKNTPLEIEDFKQIEQKISKLDWWGRRLLLKPSIKGHLQIAVIYCGEPKNTDDVLDRLDKMYSIPVEDLGKLFDTIFPEKRFSIHETARPICDFVKKYPQSPPQTKLYAKSLFNESLGLLSFLLLRTLEQGKLEEVYPYITKFNKALDFYGVFTGKLVTLYDFVKEKVKKEKLKDKNINEDIKNVGFKLTGAGGGGDLVVIGYDDLVQGIEDSFSPDEYCIHYTSGHMEWETQGLTILLLPLEESDTRSSQEESDSSRLDRIASSVESLLEIKKKKSAPINIKFTNKKVTVEIEGETPDLGRRELLRLAEYIIFKKEVHWLWGYVILHKFKPEKYTPEEQFKNHIYSAKSILKKHGIHIDTQNENGDWEGVYSEIDDNVVSEIGELMDVYKKACNKYKREKNIPDAIKILSKITQFSYGWYTFTDAYMNLAEWIAKDFEGDEVREDAIERCWGFLTWYIRRLRIGLERIDSYMKQPHEGKGYYPLSEVAERELEIIKAEYKKAKRFYKTFLNERPLSPEEEDYEVLVEQFRKIQINFGIMDEELGKEVFGLKKAVTKDEAKNRKKPKVHDRHMLDVVVKRLCDENKTMNEIIKNVHGWINRQEDYSQAEKKAKCASAYYRLGEIILRFEESSKIELSTGAQLNYLKRKLNGQLLNELKSEEKGFTPKQSHIYLSSLDPKDDYD